VRKLWFWRWVARQQGRGRNAGDAAGAGPGGWCVCPVCGHTEQHVTGEPCNERKCPECGAVMTRSV